MEPDSTNINVNSTLTDSINLFICAICNCVVSPFPIECPECNGLYCKDCVDRTLLWQCKSPLQGDKCISS